MRTVSSLPPCVRSGYRVACTDLRGHGDSDATFTSYGDVETAGDIIALIEELEGPAVVVGNSMGAGAAAYAAAERPDLINGLVLVGPFVRNGKTTAHAESPSEGRHGAALGGLSWNSYLPKLYKGQRPVDFDKYRKTVVASLRRPGYAKSFSLTTRTDHSVAESRLAEVAAPTMVVMGEQDPDFPDPRAEAEWISHTLHGSVVMVPDAGHYPQSQQPDITIKAVLSFLEEVDHGA